jgi:poly-gamma-glutamate capsule biosynthesis protein CapA/YwtB (metallophosphatase superfamily)
MYKPSARRRSNKKILILLAVLALVVATVVGGVFMTKKAVAPSAKPIARAPASPKPDSGPITLVATGDWIAHDTINAQARQADGSYDYAPLVADLKPYLAKSDIRFCNDPILNGGKVSAITGYPKFNSPADFVTGMGKYGCNLVNTASNHSFDFTQANITASVDAWKAVPNTLAVAGENSSPTEHDVVHYFTIKGIKFAFLAYTTYINADAPVQNDYGVNVFSTAFAGKQIAEAKAAGAKVIIASMRWGTEYSTTVTGEQQKDAQWLADRGVQLVLGHGSHELQPVQQLTGSGGGKTIVWYSLGNFLNTQIPPETLFNGLAYMTIDPKSYEVSVTGYLPLYVHYEWSAAQAAAETIAARTNVHMYLLEKTTQSQIDAQQLKTTVAAQQQRMTTTLSAYGATVPLLTSSQVPQ